MTTTVEFRGNAAYPYNIHVGVTGEYNVERVYFQPPKDGIMTLHVTYADGAVDVYDVTNDGLWVIDATVTRHTGKATAYLQVTTTDMMRMWRSEEFNIIVTATGDIDGELERQYPSVIDQALVQVHNDTVAAAASAEAAAESAAAVGDQALQAKHWADEALANNFGAGIARDNAEEAMTEAQRQALNAKTQAENAAASASTVSQQAQNADSAAASAAQSAASAAQSALAAEKSLQTIDLPNTLTAGSYINADTGASVNSANLSRTGMIDVSAYKRIVYSRIALTSTSSAVGLAWYADTTVGSYVSGQRCIPKAASASYVETVIEVPENANYVRISAANSLDGFFIRGIRQPVNFNGKHLSLLGDSISSYTGFVPDGNDVYYTGSNAGVAASAQMWWSVLCNRTGMKPLVINGWSGSGVTQLTDSAHAGKVPMSDVSRCKNLHKDGIQPDVILIAGGVNDYSYAENASQSVGSWDGHSAPVRGTSFDETYACMIADIQQAYPNAKLYALSTFFTLRGTDNGVTYTNGMGKTQADYDAAIERVAAIMRIPFINIAKCGFSRSNYYPTYAVDSSTTPTHPNAAGHKVIGEYIAEALLSGAGYGGSSVGGQGGGGYDDTEVKKDIGELKSDISDLKTRVTAIEDMGGLHRYGVSGIGLANVNLTRLYDAVGMTAQVGTDGDNSNVINNFDDVAPFNRRKCVGEWRLYEGKPVFHVNAYYGDPDYTEDGNMGDYVAVDCPPAYYKYDAGGGELVISAHHFDGYRPFDCLMDRTTGECRPHTYLPCYALAMKDGHAVSLPGLRNEQGDYKKLFDTCKTAANNAAAQAMLMPIAVNFYEWAMFTVEFATTNCQSVMQGCASLRHSNDDLIVMSSTTEGIVQNHQAARVVGECVSIQPSNVDVNTTTWLASHRIASIERCNQDGTPNASGAYNHVTFEVLDETRAIEVGETYRIAARPYNTGDCNSVSTPSGSPVSNTNGYYPMKYRWRENVYGNQYQTVSDLMNFAVVEEGFANANANYAAHLEWYYYRDPETLVPTNYANSIAGRDTMIAEGWELLDVTTPSADYVNGYVKSREHSHKYPDVWKPGVTTGASASTYYADYAYLVTSNLLRAVRLGGSWYYGANVGFSIALAHYAPSLGSAHFGGGLYYPQ